MLTIRECMVIDLAELRVASHAPGRRDQIIREHVGYSAMRYYQVLSSLLERPEALAYAPARSAASSGCESDDSEPAALVDDRPMIG